MNPSRPFPRPRAAWLFLVSLAALAHGAVYAGGLVRPEPLARLAQAQRAAGFGAFDFWAALTLSFGDPLAAYPITAVWTFAGFLLAYGAAARLFGHFAALAAAGAALVLGYPGWVAVSPSPWQFALLPAGAAALGASWFTARPLAPWRARLADWATRRWVKAAWIVLLTFAAFVVAENARLGFRGAPKGKFPYAANGLPHGFDRDLNDLRQVQHAGFFREAVASMRGSYLPHDNRAVCLAGHGGAARFVCRVGRAWPDVTVARRTPRLVAAGWEIRRTARGLEAQPGSGGFRYVRLHGTVDGEEVANWYALRDRVLARPARRVTVEGPLYRRGNGKNLRIELEVTSARGARATASYDGEPLTLLRRDLAAGDRVVVLFAARLPSPLPRTGAPVVIEVEAPAGLLDFDVFLEALVEDPAEPAPRHGTPLWSFGTL